MSSFVTIKDNLNTNLQTLVSTDNVISEMIFGRRQSTAGYPYGRFYIARTTTKHLATHDYWRGWGFYIEIVQSIANDNEEQAEIDLGKAMDALMNLLEEEWDLSGDVLDDMEGDTSEHTSEDGRVVVARFLAMPRTFINY